MRRNTALRGFVTVPVLLDVVACPSCGVNVDVWAGEPEVRCGSCGQLIVWRQRTVH